jgi:rod shape determining protein RodA
VDKREGQLYNIDWLLIIQYLMLVTIGVMSVFANEFDEGKDMFNFSFLYMKQITWFGVAIVFALTILLLDTRVFSYYSTVAYIILCGVLLALIFVGKEVNGAKSWISIGSFAIQPSEFTKIATALMLSFFLSKTEQKDISRNFNFIKVFMIIGIPVLLIIGQNDFGSSFVFFSFVLVLYKYGFSYIILVSAGVFASLAFSTILLGPLATTLVSFFLILGLYHFMSRKLHEPLIVLSVAFISIVLLQSVSDLFLLKLKIYSIIVIVLVAISLLIIIWSLWHKLKKSLSMALVCILICGIPLVINYVYGSVLKDYQRNRIDVFLGMKDDPSRINYNVIQSTIAIGSGGVTGKGYLKGTQTRLNFVPEQETDFIFCTIGEEYGFLGSFLFIILYLSFLIRIIVIAERQRERMSKYYGYCVFSIFLFHFGINISMTVGLFPVIGIPLPLISYGGSSLLAFTCLLFIFLNFDSNRMKFLQNV